MLGFGSDRRWLGVPFHGELGRRCDSFGVVLAGIVELTSYVNPDVLLVNVVLDRFLSTGQDALVSLSFVGIGLTLGHLIFPLGIDPVNTVRGFGRNGPL